MRQGLAILLRVFRRFAFTIPLLCLSTAAFAQSGGDEPKISFSGYVQPQYQIEFRNGSNADRVLLRRMVLALDADLSTNWRAEFQADVGPVASGGDRVLVKNAFLQYAGWKSRGIVVTLGNQKVPFSRSVLGSSSRRGLVERPFTGDRSLGSPGRALSLKVDGWHAERTVHWSAALAETRHSQEPDEIRVDGAAEFGSGGSEGQLLAARIELHPLGEVPREHGDFERGPMRFTVGAAAYGWWNDGDAPVAEVMDAARTSGVEVSGALRGGGLSLDAELDRITSRAPGAATSGLYVNGASALTKASLEAGYMVVPKRLEGLVGLDALQTDAHDATWRRAAVGMNWYVRGHDLKFSFMHRESFNDRGRPDRRSRASYLQAQFAF